MKKLAMSTIVALLTAVMGTAVLAEDTVQPEFTSDPSFTPDDGTPPSAVPDTGTPPDFIPSDASEATVFTGPDEPNVLRRDDLSAPYVAEPGDVHFVRQRENEMEAVRRGALINEQRAPVPPRMILRR